MNSDELNIIETKIIEEIEKTLQSISHYKELTKPIAPENAIGRISRIDAIKSMDREQKMIMPTVRMTFALRDLFGWAWGRG